MSSEFENLFDIDEDSYKDIIKAMLDGKDITTKTEINAPLAFTKLEFFGHWLKSQGVDNADNLISKFCALYRVNMISFKRQSRKEAVQMVTEGLKRERTASEKLMSKEKGAE